MKMSSRLLASVLPVLMAAVAILSPAVVSAEQNEAPNRVVGAWSFYAQFPGAPSPTFVGSAQFESNGTISGTPIDQHTGPAIGVWQQLGGNQYAFTFVANTYDASGTYTATHRVRGMLTLGDDGVSASGKTALEVLNSAGVVIFTATSTFTGQRLTIQPF